MGCSVMVTLQILVLPLGVRIPSSQSNKWSLRLSARTGDSQSSKRGSIPLGTIAVPAQSGLAFFFDSKYYQYEKG